jgi:hypothetical protein
MWERSIACGSIEFAFYSRPRSPRDTLHRRFVCASRGRRGDNVEPSVPDLPAIRQQLSLTTPHAALCDLDAIRVMSSADMWEQVGVWWCASGWLVNGMQELRACGGWRSPRGYTSRASSVIATALGVALRWLDGQTGDQRR